MTVLYPNSLEEHEEKFNKLMEKVSAANLKLHPDKCEFLRPEVAYLGHMIDKEGVRPDPKKIEAVKNFPIPKNPKNIKQFLGLAGYYRRFIDGFSKIATTLNQLLKKDIKFIWSEKQQEAFELLKEKLCEEPLLKRPDLSQPFILTTDASGFAIGGILSRGKIGKDKPIAYISRSLNDCERKYDIRKRSLSKYLLRNIFLPLFIRKKMYLGHRP